jgi:hypothetical protein
MLDRALAREEEAAVEEEAARLEEGRTGRRESDRRDIARR